MAGLSFNHFAEIAAELGPILEDIVSETAEVCVKNIQAHILANGQVDTGDMLNSVHTAPGADGYTREIQIDMYYWVYQNYGTRFMAARPFLEPGVQDTEPVFQALLAGFESRLRV